MLYTFSQATYNNFELEQTLTHAQSDDAILLWQDGVNLLLKYPSLLQIVSAQLLALDIDLKARGLIKVASDIANLKIINLDELVTLTQDFYPQQAL